MLIFEHPESVRKVDAIELSGAKSCAEDLHRENNLTLKLVRIRYKLSDRGI